MISVRFHRDLSKYPRGAVVVEGPFVKVVLKNKRWLVGLTELNQLPLDQTTIAQRNHDGTWDAMIVSGRSHYEEWEMLPYSPAKTPVKQAKRRTVLIQPNSRKKEPTHVRSQEEQDCQNQTEAQEGRQGLSASKAHR